ncbi:MAG: hypothetical protein QOG67_1381 [Verrucomicrobiota bacterium]|jgi:hypothetical protein
MRITSSHKWREKSGSTPVSGVGFGVPAETIKKLSESETRPPMPGTGALPDNNVEVLAPSTCL